MVQNIAPCQEVSEENITIKVCERLKDERIKSGRTQIWVAEACNASKRSVVEWEKATPIPADKLALLGKSGFDTQYIMTGQQSDNVPRFEDKLEEFRSVTERLEALARQQTPRPDPYQLVGPLRELVWSARLSDQQIQVILNLLHAAREPGFWLGVESSGSTVTQNVRGKHSQVAGRDMTVSNTYHSPVDRPEGGWVHDEKPDNNKTKK